MRTGKVLTSPMKTTLDALESKRQVVFRYVDESGNVTPESNPNGSMHNIAGICNEARNVVGMMPHPDRAWDRKLGQRRWEIAFRFVGRSPWNLLSPDKWLPRLLQS